MTLEQPLRSSYSSRVNDLRHKLSERLTTFDKIGVYVDRGFGPGLRVNRAQKWVWLFAVMSMMLVATVGHTAFESGRFSGGGHDGYAENVLTQNAASTTASAPAVLRHELRR